MKMAWTWALLAAALAGCMGTEPDKPKPRLEPVSSLGGAFGQTKVNTRKQLDFVLRNSDAGFGAVEPLKDIVITNTGTGATVSHTCPSELEEGRSCFITVSYRPAAAGTLTGILRVTSNAEQGALEWDLSGSAVDTLDPAQGVAAFATGNPSGDFAADGTRSYRISNIGNEDDAITITGPSEDGWSFEHDCGTTLAVGASCDIDVTFESVNDAVVVPSPLVITDAYNREYGPLTVILRATGQ